MGHGAFDDTRQVLNHEHPSISTTRNLIKEMDTHDLILDVGDISYAVGYAPVVSIKDTHVFCNNRIECVAMLTISHIAFIISNG